MGTHTEAVSNVSVTPTLTCVAAFKFQMVGSGNTSITKSVMIFGMEEYMNSACVFIQLPLVVVVQSRDMGLHWKMAAKMKAMVWRITVR